MSSAVERMEPIAIDDSPTATARASMNNMPTSLQPDAARRRQVRTDRTEQQWPVDQAEYEQGGGAQGDDDGHDRRVDGEDRPEEDLLCGAGGGAPRRIQVEEQRGQARGRSQNDAGRHVPAARPLDSDHFHRTPADDPAGDETSERGQPQEERARSPGGGDISQRVAGKGLAPDYRETADDRRDDGRQGSDERRGLDRAAGEESRLEEKMHATSGDGYGRVVGKVVCLGARFGHDKNPAVQLQHVDVMSVELGEDLGSHDLVGGAARRPSLCQIDDPVHYWQERIHLVRREEHRRPRCRWRRGAGVPRSPARSWVEVRQGFVEEEQLRSTDQRVGYQYPLLFSSRECPDPGVSEAICIDVVDHLSTSSRCPLVRRPKP